MNAKLLRVIEAAEALNVSRWTIYRWVEEGRLEATKIGKGSLRVFEKSVQRLIETNRKDQFSLVTTGRPSSRKANSAGAVCGSLRSPFKD